MKLVQTLALLTLIAASALHPSVPEKKLSQSRSTVALFEACKNNNNKDAIIALLHDPAVNSMEIESGNATLPVEYKGWTPLHYAAFNGNVTLLKQLIAQGGNPAKADLAKRTPLIIACEEAQVEVVQHLLTTYPFPLVKKGETSLLEHTYYAQARNQEALTKLSSFAPQLAQQLRETKMQEQTTKEQMKKLLIQKHAKELLNDFTNTQNEIKALTKKIDNHARIIVLIKQLLIRQGEDCLEQGNVKRTRLIVSNGGTSLEKTVDEAQKKLNEDFLKAAAEGKFTTLKLRIKQGAQLNHRDENGNTALHFAAKSGNGKLVDYLLSLKKVPLKTLNTLNNENQSPLHLAAKKGNLEIVKKLINAGAPSALSDLKDSKGRTPLHFAVYSGNIGLVTFFVEREPEAITLTDAEGLTPFHFAILLHKKVPLVAAMLEKNTELLIKKNILTNNLIKHVAKNGELEILKLLVQKTIPLLKKIPNNKAITFKKESWLNEAISQGHLPVVTYLVQDFCSLIDRHASWDLAELKKALQRAHDLKEPAIEQFLSKICIPNNALFEAIKAKNITHVRQALLDGANPNSISSHTLYSGLTSALQEAVAGNFVEAVEELLKNGALPEQLVYTETAPIDQALNQKPINCAIVELLLQHSTSINAPQKLSYDTWRLFLKKGTAGVVALFEKYGLITFANDKPPRRKNNSLYLAVKADNVPVVKALLKAGFNPTATNTYGKTPLHVVQSVEVAKLLINYGASTTAVDNYHRTPLKMARRKSGTFSLKKVELIEFLSGKCCDFGGPDKEVGAALFDNMLGNSCLTDVPDGEGSFEERYNQTMQTCIKKLINQGLDVNLHDTSFFGKTPLYWACDNNYREIVKFLIEKNAHLDAECGYKTNALETAVEKGYDKIVELLLRNGAKPTIEACNQAISHATTPNGLAIMSLVLSRYKTICDQEGRKNAVLLNYVASQKPCTPGMVELLNHVDANYENLQLAIYSGNLEAVKLLVRRGAEPDMPAYEFAKNVDDPVARKEIQDFLRLSVAEAFNKLPLLSKLDYWTSYNFKKIKNSVTAATTSVKTFVKNNWDWSLGALGAATLMIFPDVLGFKN